MSKNQSSHLSIILTFDRLLDLKEIQYLYYLFYFCLTLELNVTTVVWCPLCLIIGAIVFESLHTVNDS